jgi:hypothetical protein
MQDMRGSQSKKATIKRTNSYCYFLACLLCFLIINSCQTDENETIIETPDIKLEAPTKSEMEKYSIKISQSLKQEPLTIMQTELKKGAPVKEACDGLDNNQNGLVDEGCFGCCPKAKRSDFDCDGTITLLDCTFPILYAYSKTTVKESSGCADLDGDKKIGLGDSMKCLDIYNGRN